MRCFLGFCLVLIMGFSTIEAAVWQPAPGTTWQWQLTGTINTSWDVQMYDIDLFDAPQTTIDDLKAAGRVVICYFSAGSYEDWREDAADFPAEVLGNDLDGWEGERWLDIRRLDLLGPIMSARLDLAVTKGCDGVEPDNVDGYTNNTGFPLTYDDQLTYNRWLATQAHNRSLSIGLKNDLDQIPDLVDDFDWALNEQCFYYEECDLLLPFIEAGKAVFGVEYEGDPAVYCPQAIEMGFSWLTKTYDLADEPPNACTAGLPSKPDLLQPENNAVDVSYAPSLVWSGSGAMTFKVTIKDSAGIKAFSSSFQSAAVCAAETCSVTVSSLVNATYTWKVVAKNAVGKSASDKFTFTVEYPGKPQIITPTEGQTIPASPTITWGIVDAATEYRVKFKHTTTGAKVSTDWLAETAICDTDDCTTTLADALPAGQYTLLVQARHAGVSNRSKSAKITLTVSDARYTYVCRTGLT
jgi:hypothetical protein